jgi:hypothetical protein
LRLIDFTATLWASAPLRASLSRGITANFGRDRAHRPLCLDGIARELLLALVRDEIAKFSVSFSDTSRPQAWDTLGAEERHEGKCFRAHVLCDDGISVAASGEVDGEALRSFPLEHQADLAGAGATVFLGDAARAAPVDDARDDTYDRGNYRGQDCRGCDPLAGGHRPAR